MVLVLAMGRVKGIFALSNSFSTDLEVFCCKCVAVLRSQIVDLSARLNETYVYCKQCFIQSCRHDLDMFESCFCSLLSEPLGPSRRPQNTRARKKSTKINFLGPETARWGGGLQREGVVAEKLAPSLESLSLGFEERNPGCPGNFAGVSRTPGDVQKVCAKRVRAHFLFPKHELPRNNLEHLCGLGTFSAAMRLNYQ